MIKEVAVGMSFSQICLGSENKLPEGKNRKKTGDCLNTSLQREAAWVISLVETSMT